MAVKGLVITSIVSTPLCDVSNLFIEIRSITGVGRDNSGNQLLDVVIEIYKDEATFDSGGNPIPYPIIDKNYILKVSSDIVNISRDDVFNALETELTNRGYTINKIVVA